MARAKKEAALTPEERLQAALVPDWEWPYKLPENWCWTRHNSIMDIVGGAQPEKAFFIREPKEGYVQLYQTRDYGENPVPVYIPQKYATKTTDEGDILLARYGGSLGKVFRAHKGAYNVALAKVIILYPEVVDDEFLYLYYYSHFYQDFCIKAGYGRSAQAGFNKSDLNELLFPLPPLAEQQRIVDRIESLFAKLDEAKEKAQAVVDSFETRKAAILHKAFTGELTAKWREEHGVRMESWRWIPLKKSGSWYGGGTPSMSRSEYWENGTLLWVTAKDMKSDLIEDTLMHTNMFGVENSSANYIAQPAVLFVMRSGILRRTFPVCMVKKPFTVNQDIKALVPTDNIDLEYLFWGCKANEKRILESCMKNGTTVESINSAALRDFEIPIAGSNEQIEIVRILDAFFAKEQQAKEAAEKVLDQIDLMKKSILARAFRGELGTNDPSEESAVELLKRTIL